MLGRIRARLGAGRAAQADTAEEGVAAATREGGARRARAISPYLAAQMEYDRRFGSMANQIRFLRGACLLAWCVAGFAVWGAIRMAGQSEVVPYIVERDKLGQIAQFGQLSAAADPDRATMVAELARFIISMRTVYTDPIAQLDMINRGYFYTRDKGRSFVDAYFSDPSRNPRVLSKDMIRQVDVTAIVPPVGGSDSWTLKWRETEIPIRGGAPTISSWEGAARVVVVPPRNAESIRRNPLGIYVSDLTWTRVSEPAKVRVEDVRGELERDREMRERQAARELGINPSSVTNQERSRR